MEVHERFQNDVIGGLYREGTERMGTAWSTERGKMGRYGEDAAKFADRMRKGAGNEKVTEMRKVGPGECRKVTERIRDDSGFRKGTERICGDER